MITFMCSLIALILFVVGLVAYRMRVHCKTKLEANCWLGFSFVCDFIWAGFLILAVKAGGVI